MNFLEKTFRKETSNLLQCHSPLSNIRELLPQITCTYPRGIFIDIKGNYSALRNVLVNHTAYHIFINFCTASNVCFMAYVINMQKYLFFLPTLTLTHRTQQLHV